MELSFDIETALTLNWFDDIELFWYSTVCKENSQLNCSYIWTAYLSETELFEIEQTICIKNGFCVKYKGWYAINPTNNVKSWISTE